MGNDWEDNPAKDHVLIPSVPRFVRACSPASCRYPVSYMDAAPPPGEGIHFIFLMMLEKERYPINPSMASADSPPVFNSVLQS